MVHDKYHSSNHHTYKTEVNNQPDSSLDCIASHEIPFHGDFVLSGTFISLTDQQDTQAACVTSNNLAVNLSSSNYSFDACGKVLCDNNILVNTLTLTNAIINVDKKFASTTNIVLHTSKDMSTCLRLWELDEVNISNFLPPKFILQPSLNFDFFDHTTNTVATLSCDTQIFENVSVTYQWYHNGAPIVGETQKTLLINTNGVYFVIAKNSRGSTKSRMVYLVPPIQASSDYVYVMPYTSVTFTVLNNDTSTLPTRVVNFTNPQNGLIEFDSVLNEFTYTPHKAYTGMDMFNYTVADTVFQTSTTTVVLSCEVVPCRCVDETIGIDPRAINSFEIGKLNKKGTLEYEIFNYTQPKYGHLTIDKNTNFAVYIPSIQHKSNDYFTYTIQDTAKNRSTGTITLTS